MRTLVVLGADGWKVQSNVNNTHIRRYVAGETRDYGNSRNTSCWLYFFLFHPFYHPRTTAVELYPSKNNSDLGSHIMCPYDEERVHGLSTAVVSN